MWSFVGKKKNQVWLWWVKEALSGEVIAFTFERRTHATFRHLKRLLTNAGIAPDEWLTD
jgi:insertion element IS1 protein InsB